MLTAADAVPQASPGAPVHPSPPEVTEEEEDTGIARTRLALLVPAIAAVAAAAAAGVVSVAHPAIDRAIWLPTIAVTTEVAVGLALLWTPLQR